MNYLISTITKNYKTNDLIKGPNYCLTISQTKNIVKYLKSQNQWTYDYLTENALILDKNILVDKLNIITKEFIDDDFIYDISLLNVDKHFFRNFNLSKVYALVLKNKLNKKRVGCKLFSSELSQKIRNYIISNQEKDLDKIEPEFFYPIFGTYYDQYFDFRFSHSIEEVPLDDYIYSSEANWFKIDGEIGFFSWFD